MIYRTKTYIAGDWTGDQNAINKLYSWKDSDFYTLDFVDAHELHNSSDSSLYCSIKENLKIRLDGSKKFILIVGEKTNTITKGNCSYCSRYSSWYNKCLNNNTTSHKSYIQYECDYAKRNIDGNNIIVLYNYKTVHKDKCPESLRYIGKHIPMMYTAADDKTYWNYSEIKNAIMN